MKSCKYFFYLFFLLPKFLVAQDSVIIYMNSDFEAVSDIKSAAIKRLAVINNNRYYITDQYVDGRHIMKGEYNSVNPWIEDGLFVFYDSKGNKYSEGNFVNGIMDGRWIYYDSSGTDTANYKKEWMAIVGAGAKFQYPGTVQDPSENLKSYLLDQIHYPPKFILDCEPKNEEFYVSISKDRVINIKPFYTRLEDDFRHELYRVLDLCPDSFLFSDNKNKTYFAVSINYTCPGAPKVTASATCNDPVFVFAEEPASFQGGDLEKFREWIQKHLVYPRESVEYGEYGRITFQFVVTKSGKVDCIKILKSSGFALLDREAVRVVSMAPLWTPAKQGGKVVNQQFVMPVIFMLQ